MVTQHRRSGMGQSLDLQTLQSEIKIFGEISNPTYRHFNPSLSWHEGKLYIALRSCNFAVERQGKWFLRDGGAYSKTDVLLGIVDPISLTIRDITKLKLSEDSPTRVLVSGLEDVRIYSRKDGLHAIGFESDRLTRSLHNASAKMAEYVIKGNELKYIRTLDKPDENIVEKNWSPTDTPSDLFDFTYSDSQVWNNGEVLGEPTKTNIHGGTQLLKQKDGTWLSIVHDKKLDPKYSRLNHLVYDKYVYRHYLARHNKYGVITHLTKPFNFGTLENIEFAAGMVEYDNHLLISLGIRDCKYAIAKIKKSVLVDMLELYDLDNLIN